MKRKYFYGTILLSLFTLNLAILPGFNINVNNSDENVVNTDISTDLSNINQPTDFNTKTPSSSAIYDKDGDYSWFNTDWTYRVPIQINSTHYNRTDYSVVVKINMTEIMDNMDPQVIGEFDSNSIRVVEYDDLGEPVVYNSELTESNQYIAPSRFIPNSDSYDASTNAHGQLWFEMKDLTVKNTNRTFFIYFDTIANGPKAAPSGNILWSKQYDYETDMIGDGKFHLAYGNYYTTGSATGTLQIWNDDLTETIGNPQDWGNVNYYFLMAPGDFNGDDNVEIVMTEGQGNSYVFYFVDYNKQTETMQTQFKGNYDYRIPLRAYFNSLGYDASAYNPQIYDFTAFDMDGDGKTEIVCADYNANRNFGRSVIIFGMNESNDLYVKNWINISIYQSLKIALADFNNDGFMDMVTGNWNNYNISTPATYNGTISTLIYNQVDKNYTQTDYYSNTTSALYRTLPQNIYSIRAFDLDYDGNVEILVSRDNGWIYTWSWNGTGLEFVSRANTATTTGYLGDIADWDNDGKVNVAVGNFRDSLPRSLRVFPVNQNNELILSEYWANDSIDYTRTIHPTFGDVDNDGTMEMSVGSYFKTSTANRDGKITIWGSNSPSIPQWTSPDSALYNGMYSHYSANTLIVLGGKSSLIYKPNVLSHIYVLDAEIKPSDIKFYILDSNYEPLSDIKVNLYKESLLDSTKYTNSLGMCQFIDVKFETYELNVTLISDFGEKSLESTMITIDQTRMVKYIITDAWKMKFKLFDMEGLSFNKANITLFENELDDNPSVSAHVDVNGEMSFNYMNRDSNRYNYSVIFNNPLYSNNNLMKLMSDETVQIIENQKIFNFNGTEPSMSKIDLEEDVYLYTESFYANGSDEETFGYNHLNWANISLSNIENNIKSVQIIGIAKSGDTWTDTSYITYTSDFESNDIQNWNKEIYFFQNYVKFYGIKVQIEVYDPLIENNGIINLTMKQGFVQNITLPLAQYRITVQDTNELTLENAIVRIYNETDQFLIELKTNEAGLALDLDGSPLWYRTVNPSEGNFSAVVNFFGASRLFSSSINPQAAAFHVNFSYVDTSEAIFTVKLNLEDFQVLLTLPDYINSNQISVDYRSNLILDINLQTKESSTADPIFRNPKEITILLQNASNAIVLEVKSDQIENPQTGRFTYVFNASDLGIQVVDGNNAFSLQISVESGFGVEPFPISKTLIINPISTTSAVKINEDVLTQYDIYWGKKVNLTLNYLDGTDLIDDADVKIFLPWEGLEGSVINGDKGEYQIEIDTVDAINVGSYRIRFEASKTNFETQTGIEFLLNIKSLETSINGSDMNDILYKRQQPIEVYITKSEYIYLNYSDEINDIGIENASVSYSWTKVVNQEIKDSGNGILVELGNGLYLLDFNTVNLSEPATYEFAVRMAKTNYLSKVASFQLVMKKMTFTSDFGLTLTDLGVLQYEVIDGNKKTITITLTDDVNGGNLIGADVIMRVGEKDIPFTPNGDGTYSYEFDPLMFDIDAFYQQQPFNAKLIISKTNYTTYEVPIQINVLMPEIFSGVPTFYFLIALIGAAILVGTLTVNKLIQNSKIPGFVKVLIKEQKLIEGKKPVSKNNVAPTKIEDIYALFADDWKILDLDLKSVLEMGNQEPSDGTFVTPADEGGQ